MVHRKAGSTESAARDAADRPGGRKSSLETLEARQRVLECFAKICGHRATSGSGVQAPVSRELAKVHLRDRRVGAVDNYFWGTLSVTLLAVLVGLVVVMLRDDLRRRSEQRRH
jgi:hypothetical protein